MILELKQHGLFYLATPYRAFPDGELQAYNKARTMTDFMLARGWNVFCPIAYGHNTDKALHDRGDAFWLYNIDRTYLYKCDGLIIVRMEGYQKSVGIYYERGVMHGLGKPVAETDYLKEPSSEDFEY